MNRWTVLFAALLITVIAMMGCSSGNGSPVLPNAGTELTNGNSAQDAPQSQTHLWGYYDLYFDFENQTVEAVPNRNFAFTANVTGFVNNPASNLSFGIWGTPLADDGTYVDVDIDVGIAHPFPGLHQYDGYDVRGIFMGNGSSALTYGGGDLTYATSNVDAEMRDYNPLGLDPSYVDPYVGPYGNADGWTRWFNAPEFSAPDPLGYVHGALATPGYLPDSTLNPYKYFCDGLGPTDDLWEWLNTDLNSDGRGIFTAGATNIRNYYLRFPTPDPNVTYGYAIAATWGEAPDENPLAENCIEAVALTVTVTDNIWNDGVDGGGNFIADIDVWGWDTSTIMTEEVWQPSTVYVESEIFATNPVTVPIGPLPGGDHYSTWSVDVVADGAIPAGPTNADVWVIAEYTEYSYTEKYTAPGTVPDAPLAAFFRFPLYVNDQPYCDGPEVTGMNPAQGAFDTDVNCDILGTFGAGAATATLSQGAITIEGTNVTWIDANTLNADFALGPDLGMYDLTVTAADCPTPTLLADAFEVLDIAGPVFKEKGDLPGPFATNNEHDICVVGSNAFGHSGVYFHYSTSPTTIFQIWHYPIDYSAAATMHVNITEPFFGGVQAQLFWDDDDLRAIEVMPQGSFVFSNWNSTPMYWGGYPANGPVWWGGTNGVLVNGWLYFNMQFHDLERAEELTGVCWGYWGNNPAGVDGATYKLAAPYTTGYSALTGWYPADHTGSVDGMVSDNEAYWFAIDTDPEGLNAPFDCIAYYIEGPPDAYGIEVMQNVQTLAFPVSLTTIDTPYDGTGVIPVDVCVAQTYGSAPSATTNWACVLEDNGDGTWSFVCYDQTGAEIGRQGPYDGTPWHVDVDEMNVEAHVWCDNAGTPEYYIFEFV